MNFSPFLRPRTSLMIKFCFSLSNLYQSFGISVSTSPTFKFFTNLKALPGFLIFIPTGCIDLSSLCKNHNILKEFYKTHKFIKVQKIDSLISTNNVINTNNCFISVCRTKHKNKLVILSAIDNLIKGGARQAIQNMNLKFGFKYNEGLK